MIVRFASALSIASTLAGCDIVWGLEGDLPARDGGLPGAPFCERQTDPDVLFCADFDDPNATFPLSQFVSPDMGSSSATIDVESMTVSSAPNAARLGVQFNGTNSSFDARLQRTFQGLPSNVTISLRLFIPDAAPSDVKVLSWNNVDRAYSLYAGGRLIANVNGTFKALATCPPLQKNRWIEIELAVDPINGTSHIAYDECDEAPIAADPGGTAGNATLSIGPHDPQNIDNSNSDDEWTTIFDDILIRETNP